MVAAASFEHGLGHAESFLPTLHCTWGDQPGARSGPSLFVLEADGMASEPVAECKIQQSLACLGHKDLTVTQHRDLERPLCLNGSVVLALRCLVYLGLIISAAQ